MTGYEMRKYFLSEHQNIFEYKKTGYHFRKGLYKDIPINEIWKTNSDWLEETLFKIESEATFKTKMIIRDIKWLIRSLD
jgi:hypothetical protein